MKGLSETSFTKILQEAQRGDPQAIGDLLIAYRSYLQLIARIQTRQDRKLRGKVEPSDLVQETIIQAQQHIEKFRGLTPNQFMAWLRQILAGQFAQQVRRFRTKKRDPQLERSIHRQLEESSRMLEAALVSPSESPSEKVTHGEEAALVAEALENLPTDHREVIIMRNLEQRPFAEVAHQMNRSVDATKQLWVRAIKGLRDAVK